MSTVVLLPYHLKPFNTTPNKPIVESKEVTDLTKTTSPTTPSKLIVQIQEVADLTKTTSPTTPNKPIIKSKEVADLTKTISTTTTKQSRRSYQNKNHHIKMAEVDWDKKKVKVKWDDPFPSHAELAQRNMQNEAYRQSPTRAELDSMSISREKIYHLVTETPSYPTTEDQDWAEEIGGRGYTREPPKSSMNDKQPTFGVIWRCRESEPEKLEPESLARNLVRTRRPGRNPVDLTESVNSLMKKPITNQNGPQQSPNQEQSTSDARNIRPEVNSGRSINQLDGSNSVDDDPPNNTREETPILQQFERKLTQEEFETRHQQRMTECMFKDIRPALQDPFYNRHSKPGGWSEFRLPPYLRKRPPVEDPLEEGAIRMPPRSKKLGLRFLPEDRVPTEEELLKEQEDAIRERHVFKGDRTEINADRAHRDAQLGPDIVRSVRIAQGIQPYYIRAQPLYQCPRPSGPKIPIERERYAKADPAPAPEYFYPGNKQRVLIPRRFVPRPKAREPLPVVPVAEYVSRRRNHEMRVQQTSPTIESSPVPASLFEDFLPPPSMLVAGGLDLTQSALVSESHVGNSSPPQPLFVSQSYPENSTSPPSMMLFPSSPQSPFVPQSHREGLPSARLYVDTSYSLTRPGPRLAIEDLPSQVLFSPSYFDNSAPPHSLLSKQLLSAPQNYSAAPAPHNSPLGPQSVFESSPPPRSLLVENSSEEGSPVSSFADDDDDDDDLPIIASPLNSRRPMEDEDLPRETPRYLSIFENTPPRQSSFEVAVGSPPRHASWVARSPELEAGEGNGNGNEGERVVTEGTFDN